MFSETPNQYRVEILTSRNLLLRQRFWWRLVDNRNNEVLAVSEMLRDRMHRNMMASRLAEALRCAVVEK